MPTREEFEIMRKACYLWQETAQVWEQRALKAEARVKELEEKHETQTSTS